uniref:RNA exonuclease 4 n=1 Tax=Aegilops tauschii TaxID=37682 RepID=N1QXE6_AEGTA
MDNSSDAHSRHRCAACYRQFNRMEHLVEHMRPSHHSRHEPRCGVCGKHCRSLDALRDHLGFGASLPSKPACATAFQAHGCPLCLAVFPTSAALRAHCAACKLSRAPIPSSVQSLTRTMSRMGVRGGGGAVALGCKMVGGGSDGTLDVCARVCVVDEHEAILYESFVKPLIPVTHYRYESTGIRPEHLRDAPTVKQATRRIQDILLNGEQSYYSSRGAARLLVGHGLEHALDALGMDYPAHLRRDTAAYPPLMKTSARLMSNSLRYLTRSCLGYDIQTGGHHHPYDDCVAAMRLYKRMRAMRDQHGRSKDNDDDCTAKAFPSIGLQVSTSE